MFYGFPYVVAMFDRIEGPKRSACILSLYTFRDMWRSVVIKFCVAFWQTQAGLSIGKLVFSIIKGVLHPWALFLKNLCIFSKN